MMQASMRGQIPTQLVLAARGAHSTPSERADKLSGAGSRNVTQLLEFFFISLFFSYDKNQEERDRRWMDVWMDGMHVWLLQNYLIAI